MTRKLAAILAVSLLCLTGMADMNAQSRYGVIGGINFSTANIKDLNRGTMTQWHAGLTYKLDLPLGFSLQPSLIYNVKGAKVGAGEIAKFDLSMGYVELPVSLQWGPDLLLFRPFLDVTPYIGYAVSKNFNFKNGEPETGTGWTSLQRFEYGLGLGIGLEIWRFQVIGRYNWNFGSLYDARVQDAGGLVKDVFDGKNFGGITLSVAFLFGGGRK